MDNEITALEQLLSYANDNATTHRQAVQAVHERIEQLLCIDPIPADRNQRLAELKTELARAEIELQTAIKSISSATTALEICKYRHEYKVSDHKKKFRGPPKGLQKYKKDVATISEALGTFIVLTRNYTFDERLQYLPMIFDNRFHSKLTRNVLTHCEPTNPHSKFSRCRFTSKTSGNGTGATGTEYRGTFPAQPAASAFPPGNYPPQYPAPAPVYAPPPVPGYYAYPAPYYGPQPQMPAPGFAPAPPMQPPAPQQPAMPHNENGK